MDEELKNRLDRQDEIIGGIFKSVEKTRKYFLAVLVITVVTFVLPMIAMFFVLPWFVNSYMSSFSGLI